MLYSDTGNSKFQYIRARKKLVSHVRMHNYVDSLLLHYPRRKILFLPFFFFFFFFLVVMEKNKKLKIKKKKKKKRKEKDKKRKKKKRKKGG